MGCVLHPSTITTLTNLRELNRELISTLSHIGFREARVLILKYHQLIVPIGELK
jgi:hypothetical protein